MENPFERLPEEGDRAFHAGRPRNDNPHPAGTETRERWFSQWDACAQTAALVIKADGTGALYRAGLEVAALLRDMRNHPRTLSTRSPRFREAEAKLLSALSQVQSAAHRNGGTVHAAR